MKRLRLILLLGLLGATVAFGIGYVWRLHLAGGVSASALDELGWLKQEFRLSDAEFARIQSLHATYLPHCRAMCAQVEAVNERLRGLLNATNHVTPEIAKALSEAAEIRARCQGMMFDHFYEVSRAMPPEQGRRYLIWVQQQTLLPTYHSAGHSTNSGPAKADAPAGHRH
jgi:Heavy-metal resistance